MKIAEHPERLAEQFHSYVIEVLSLQARIQAGRSKPERAERRTSRLHDLKSRLIPQVVARLQ